MRVTMIALAIALSGCSTVGPDYRRPDVDLNADDTFVSAPASAVSMPTAADLRWWQRFDDPLLSQWVERALAGNLDVAIAFERIDQAQALLRSARAQRGVSLDASVEGGATYRHSRGNNRNNQGTTGPSASAGLAVNWDADLWGGLRQAERSAAAAVLRSQDLAQAARLATASLTARSYVTWREAQHEQALLQETQRVLEDTRRIAKVRVDAGLAPTLDLVRAQTDLAVIEAELNDAAGRTRQAELALHVLTGQRPTAPLSSASAVSPIPQMDGVLPVPRPIDLLRLRPDVRAAEHALASAFADIGVAEAALRPQLTLPGNLLLSAGGLGTDTVVRTLTASLGALLDVSLFDGGQREATVDSARSRAREAALVYRKTVLEALQQVEAALIANHAVAAQHDARQAAAALSETALQQARTLYTEGLSGFLDVLEVQRTRLENRMALMHTEADAARAAIALFEATGLIEGRQRTIPSRLQGEG